MNKMHYNIKLFLIILLPLMGVSYFAYYTITNNISEEARFAKYAHKVKNIKLITDVITNIQNERGVSIGYLTSKNASDRKKLLNTIQNQYPLTDLAISKFVHDLEVNRISTDNIFFEGITSKELSDFRLKIIRKQVNVNNVLTFYGEITRAGLVFEVFQFGGMTESQKKTNVLLSLTEAKEDMGILRATILSLLSDTNGLNEKINDVEQQYKFYSAHIKLFHVFGSENLKDKFNLYLGSNNAQKTLEAINGLIHSKKLPDFSRDEFWEYSTGTLASFNSLLEQSSTELEEDVIVNKKTVNKLLLSNIGILIALIISTFIFFFLTMKAIRKGLWRMNEAVRKMSIGQFDEFLVASANDDIGKLTSSINAVSVNSGLVISEVQRIEKGDILKPVQSRSHQDVLSISLEKIRGSFSTINNQSKAREWKDDGVKLLAGIMRKENNLDALADNIINLLVTHLAAQIGNIYIKQERKLILAGSFAFDRKHSPQEIQIGEGLVGQVAKTKETLLFSDIPSDYFNVNSSLGEHSPRSIIIAPLIFNNKLEGVIEIGSVESITQLQKEFLEEVSHGIGVALNTTISREKLKKIQLEFAQQIAALNNSAIVSEADANGNITFMNEKFCEISEYSREELLGQNHRILKSGRQPEGLFIGMWKSISMGNIWHGELLNKKKGGGFYWVDTTIMPFKNAEGKIYKYVGIRFDITKQKEQQEILKNQTEELIVQQEELHETNSELEAQSQKLQASEEELKVQQDELMEANQELEEKSQLLSEKNQAVQEKNKKLEAVSIELQQKAEELALSSKYKSEFLANMSHELRTPLNSILLLSRLLADNDDHNLTDEQIEFAGVIHNSGNGLLELINEILDLSKIESGKMELDLENIQVANILKDINDIFNPLAKNKGIEYSCKSSNELPNQMISDRMRVEQVLKNFLSNAFKFTEKGGVQLIVRRPEENEAEKMKIDRHNFVAFEVKDSGIGIPPEKHAMVFEAFQQADGSTRRKYGGTGLGLSISREIARMLGGDVLLKSEVGKGSSFTMIIPLRSEINSAFTINEERNEVFMDKISKTILLVDENENHTLAMSRYLSDASKNCVRASSAKQAYQVLNNQSVDCLVLDMGLPDENGYDVLETIKKDPKFENLPVIIYTGTSLSPQEEKKLKQYADAIIIKTADSFQRLYSEISLFLNSVEENNAEKIPKKPYIKDNALNGKHILIVDDDVRNIFSLTKLLENHKIKVSSASDGHEALSVINNDKSIDLVLMDMMMPQMDGYEATTEIRKSSELKKIPVIAVTAKAMLGEREKCIKAGANDYVTKPVDGDQLMSLLRVWLYK